MVGANSLGVRGSDSCRNVLRRSQLRWLGWVHLHEWHCAITSHSRGEACFKGLIPSAVVDDNSWLDPGLL